MSCGFLVHDHVGICSWVQWGHSEVDLGGWTAKLCAWNWCRHMTHRDQILICATCFGPNVYNAVLQNVQGMTYKLSFGGFLKILAPHWKVV